MTTIDELIRVIEELSSAGRDVVARGLVIASGGNLSARIPGADEFVVTAAGTWLDRLTPEDFSVVGLDGIVRGGNERPSIEWQLHHRAYAARPDIAAVVHLHPQAAILLDALGHPVRLITLDHVHYVRAVARVPFLPAGSADIAESVAAALGRVDVVLMAHHGSACVGNSVGMALRRAMNLEQAAELSLRCLQLGDTTAAFPPEWLAHPLAV